MRLQSRLFLVFAFTAMVFTGLGTIVLPIYGRLALCREYYPRLSKTACLFAGKIAVVDPNNIADDNEDEPVEEKKEETF